MEQERLIRENEEKEKAERAKKIKEQFVDPNSQWERDKTDIQSMAMLEKAKEQEASEGAAEHISNSGAPSAEKNPPKAAVSANLHCLLLKLYLTEYRQIHRVLSAWVS